MSLILDGTNGLSDVDGTAAAPAIRGTDANTGIFFPAADTIAFAEGGAEAARFDSGGNLGVGSTSITTGVSGTETTLFLKGNSAGKAASFVVANNAGTGVGFLGIGTDNLTYLLAQTNNALVLGTNNTERARIDSSGNFMVGITSTVATAAISIQRPSNTATYIYQIKNNQVECTWGFKASTDTNMYIGSGSTSVGTYGVYLANAGSSWNAVSDERMKTIVEPIENAVDKVSSLRAVIGYYNNDKNQIRHPFLIAQDVQAVLPEAVNIQDVETGTLGMSYTDTIPLLVAAIKEQQALITALTTRITALEGAA
jgi:hypothetical protein